jgi:hypothetical protein
MQKDPLDSLTREQLVQRIHALERNPHHHQSTIDRPFSWAKHGSRRIALCFAYKGQEYSGLTSASPSEPVRTVEGEIFNALIKSRLLPDRDVSDFSRCGRTDKV